MRITKIITTETAHRLMHHGGKCSSLHGHSYRWEVTIEGNIDIYGMVMDFAELKNILKTCIEDPFDHAVVLYKEDRLAKIIDEIFPEFNLYIFDMQPTAENFALIAAGEISHKLPRALVLRSVKVWETETSFAEWRDR